MHFATAVFVYNTFETFLPSYYGLFDLTYVDILEARTIISTQFLLNKTISYWDNAFERLYFIFNLKQILKWILNLPDNIKN